MSQRATVGVGLIYGPSLPGQSPIVSLDPASEARILATLTAQHGEARAKEALPSVLAMVRDSMQRIAAGEMPATGEMEISR